MTHDTFRTAEGSILARGAVWPVAATARSMCERRIFAKSADPPLTGREYIGWGRLISQFYHHFSLHTEPTTTSIPSHIQAVMMHAKFAALAGFLLLACTGAQASPAALAEVTVLPSVASNILEPLLPTSVFAKRQDPAPTVTVTETEGGPLVVTTSTSTIVRPTSTVHVTSTITTATTTTVTETTTSTSTRTSTVTSTVGSATVTGNRS
ncbi:hypothetical protein C8T65DRAFT_174074 [Cerioporus squamosus]|nr:hypothetical protein C8T65DRAFT_174074 [Cerioporus squamosus]